MKKILKIILATIALFLAAYYFYPEKPLPQGIKIDKISVDKSDHRMDVFSKGELIKSYKVSIGKGDNFIRATKYEDYQYVTPTGSYFIDSKFENSSFHKALTISYGNLIEIHGIKNGLGFIGKFHRFRDWTQGCIALTDKEIDELYNAVSIGTPIVIQR